MPENEEKTEEKQEKKKPVDWNQTRVPNIKKGYNPKVPFYMMGISLVFLILSIIFAKLTS